MQRHATFESGGLRLLAAFHEPDAAAPPARDGHAARAVLMCNPAFEERKSAVRPFVEAARRLCGEGWAALRFDCRGCGDSPGADGAFSLADWVEDARAAVRWLRARGFEEIAALGLRAGCAVALRTAVAEGIDRLILWEPVLAGPRYVEEILRRSCIRQMVTEGVSSRGAAGALGILRGGGVVDFDGYPLTARLYAELSAINLAAEARQFRGRLHIVNVTHRREPRRDVQEACDTLRRAGCAADAVAVTLPPFWNLVGLVDCSPLVALTASLLRAPPGPAALLPPGPPSPDLARPAPESAGEPVVLALAGQALRGMLHAPDAAAGPPGRCIVFLHGWSGCRLGPHRMFVRAARRFAAAGWACLRFDFRGRGESDGDASEASIASMTADALAAVRWIVSERGMREVVLLGICSGCKVAVSAAVADPAVSALCLWSAEPMGRMASGAGRRAKSMDALRQYALKLARPDTWKRLLAGEVNARMAAKSMADGEVASASERRAECRTLDRFGAFRGRVLFVFGGRDPRTASAAARYREFCDASGIAARHVEVAGANHSFYALDWETRVLDATDEWLRGAG